MGETGLSSSVIHKGEGPHSKEHDCSLDRRRSSSRPQSSPPRKAGSPVKSGHSLVKMASEKRARKVRFYRNGDRFFKGMVYAVSAERFRTFESLLCALTTSAVCDRKIMPNGVRHIFSVDGLRHIESLDDLQEGESYVCASMDAFRNLDYCKNEDPSWNSHVFPHYNRDHLVLNHLQQQREKNFRADDNHDSDSLYQSKGQGRPLSARDERPRAADRSKSSKSEMSAAERKSYEEYQRSFVTPRLITVVKHGRRPRRAIRLLLNRKTAQSFEQVMADITDAVKMDCGRVKKVYSLTGRQVMSLADFFQDDTVFLACGHEKISVHDLNLDNREARQVSAYRPFTGKTRERITLRKSSNSSSVSKSSGPNSGVVSPASEGLGRLHHGDPLLLEGEDKGVNKDKFDISQVPMPVALTNKYEVATLIGTGNFAVVMECKEKRTNKKFALKIINKESCKGKEKMIDNEVRILRCVKHPNIIRLVEDYTNQHQIFYIMELVRGGDLFDAIASSSTKYTEQDASGMLYNLASALEYLHSLHIVHRDVKPENILIRQHEDGTKSLKLGDFGLATEVKGPLYTVCGTPTYVAPEVIAETGYGVKIDVWSAGVIAYILLCGFPPFSSPNDNQDELFDMIMTGNYDFPSPYWDNVTASAKHVISGMLEIDPDARLSATQVLEHKWVASETQYDADLRKKVSTGVCTFFRRGPKSAQKYAGIKIIATTALDKASKFFQGRGAPFDRNRGKEE